MAFTVRHYIAGEITPALLQWLDDQAFYDTRFSEGAAMGLREIYALSRAGKPTQVTHVWVGYVGKTTVGMALLEGIGKGAFQMFVKAPHRSRGYGRRLLEDAIQAVGPLGAMYTGDSRALYQRYHIDNLC